MRHRRWLCVLLVVVAVLVAACGRSGDDEKSGGDTSSATTTTAASSESAACKGQTLKATDVGVTADTITIEVMADVGSPLAPGLFQGNIDGVKGFAEHVNATGGIACRKLVVKTWDSKLSAEESKNGLIDSCRTAFAMVGSNALFNPDMSPLTGCTDRAGAPTGLPDVAALAADPNQLCNPTTFPVQAVPEPCPIKIGSVRTIKVLSGPIQRLVVETPGLHGLFLVPGDLPTTVQASTIGIKAEEQVGLKFDGTPKVSGRAEQAAFTPVIQMLKSANSNVVINGSNDATMIKMRKETKAQGYTGVKVWGCSLACYTNNFLAAGADVEGTRVTLPFLPFEEKDTNDELAAFLDTVGNKADSWGAQSWQAAALFRQAVEDVVQESGPNGLTRKALLDALANISDFDANGWMGAKDLRGMSDCMVIMKIEGGRFVRVFPKEKGTLDCNAQNVITVTLDPAVEAAKIQ